MFVSPTVVGKAVIVGSCAGSVYALDRVTGTPIWLYDANADGSDAQFHGEPLLLGERVVIPSDGDPKAHLYSFNTASGHQLWKLPFNQGVATTPMLIDGRVVVVTVRGEVVAVDPKRGEVIWRKTPGGVLKPIPFVQSPAHAGKRVFIADNTGKIFALDKATGSTLWRKTLTARANTALVVVGKTIIVGTADGYMNWIAVDSGAMKHRLHLKDSYPYGTPVVAPPLLFVLAAGAKSNLVAVDAKSGAVRWKRETPKEWTTYRPLISGSTIIAGSTEKNLCAFDRNSGQVQWCRSIGQVPRGLGISSDGVLYVGTLSGIVRAFRMQKEATP